MIYIRIKNNSYHDSITLTLLTNVINTTDGVNNAQVMMGTVANKEIFKEMALYNTQVQNAGPNDMIIAIDSKAETVIDKVMDEVEEFLNSLSNNKKIDDVGKRLDNNHSEKKIKSRYFSISLPNQRKMGKIHSVFRTSFNVIVEGQLFNFSEHGMALSAYGCLISKNRMDQLIDSCRPGDLVRVEAAVFTIYTVNGIFKVDLSNAEEVDLSIPKLNLSLKEITQTGIYSALQTLSFDEGIGLENLGETGNTFQVLKTLSTQSENVIKSSVHHLIGRGKGLTPSGDDLLIGYTMIRKAFIGRDYFEEILQQGVETQSTTDISETFYGGVLNGYVSSLFISLILAVQQKTYEEAKTLIDRIVHYGHTSGYDTLFGFYLGLQSLINDAKD